MCVLHLWASQSRRETQLRTWSMRTDSWKFLWVPGAHLPLRLHQRIASPTSVSSASSKTSNNSGFSNPPFCRLLTPGGRRAGSIGSPSPAGVEVGFSECHTRLCGRLPVTRRSVRMPGWSLGSPRICGHGGGYAPAGPPRAPFRDAGIELVRNGGRARLGRLILV